MNCRSATLRTSSTSRQTVGSPTSLSAGRTRSRATRTYHEAARRASWSSTPRLAHSSDDWTRRRRRTPTARCSTTSTASACAAGRAVSGSSWPPRPVHRRTDRDLRLPPADLSSTEPPAARRVAARTIGPRSTVPGRGRRAHDRAGGDGRPLAPPRYLCCRDHDLAGYRRAESGEVRVLGEEPHVRITSGVRP